ncbi:MAG: FtsX-like permease family protein [Bacteroidales bacterium]|jgi:putative ABC transport system permease protein|nr:FtsX-like permease family protein [Bacteroidales bacterium]
MRYYLKITLRNLLRNPVSGFVIIFGFAFSLSVTLLLASYIFNEAGYDKSFPNINRIYRLCTEMGITTFRGDKVHELITRYPEIEMICRYDNGSTEVVHKKSPYGITNLVKTDNDFFKIFSLKIIKGNPEVPLSDNNSLVISSSMARTIFGDSDPVGKTINIQHRKDFIVTAVFDDLPENSSIQAQAVITWENVNGFGGEYRNGNYYSRIFFLLNENSHAPLLAKKITLDYSKDNYTKLSFRLLPFSNSYLDPLTVGRSGHTLHADLNSILLFSIVTVLILAISILSFVILLTSNHLTRIKEIGIKKVNGAGRREIFRQFIFEAAVISSIAFVLGIYLSLLLEIPFSSLIQKDFPVLIALRFPNILIVISGVMAVAVLTGFYPAFVISGFKPASLFGDSGIKNKMQIKSGLSVIQYLISIVMIVCLIVMTRQNNFLTNKDLGFTKKQLVNLKIPWEIKDRLPVLKEKLLGNPLIEACAVSHGIPGEVALWNMWNEPREKYGYEGSLPYFTVDADFFKVYDVQFLSGRGFKESDWKKSVIINESAFKLTGWESIEGKVLKGIPTPEQAFGRASPSEIEKNSLSVVGVIKDINVEKLDKPVSPTVFECSDHFGINYLSCRLLPGDYRGTLEYMEKVWKEICPETLFEYHFYDEWLDTLYRSETHTAYIIRVFAIISIILSCMGTFGIIHFISRQKTKEVGIRKVHGAKIADIIGILNWSILRWIMIAYIIAVPLSYFLMKKYLQGFAYRITISWWIFVIAGVMVLSIALLTVSWQSWRAATRNPVEALRYE